MTKGKWILAVLALLCGPSAYAHVGSPDVYAEGQAGPYHLSVVLRPPLVIPGVVQIDVRADRAGIDRIAITPVPLTGEASKHPPLPDVMTRSSGDAQFFTGNLWIMAPGSWQIRFAVSGAQGQGALSIPLPATALAVRGMQPGLGAALAVLGMFLVVGMVGVVGAATREATLPPGEYARAVNRRRGNVAMAIAAAVLVVSLVLGNRWWKVEAADYSGKIYKPLEMTYVLERDNRLDLELRDPGWLPQRRLDDLIPDHNHLMHLYMIRWPEMDVMFHLHPEPATTGEFQLALPSIPAGTYRLYADVVHANGFPETLVSSITLPQISGRPLAGDDAEGVAKPVTLGDHPEIRLAAQGSAGEPMHEEQFKLPDGYTMIWAMPQALVPRAPESFRFKLLDPQGSAPEDMTLYMGMLGHAAFVKTDGTVFAHIHPTGTMAMAAFMMANPQPGAADSATVKMADMAGMSTVVSNTVTFPYGFPSAGRYRIFVQMKHGNTIETGIFDADVHGPTT